MKNKNFGLFCDQQSVLILIVNHSPNVVDFALDKVPVVLKAHTFDWLVVVEVDSVVFPKIFYKF